MIIVSCYSECTLFQNLFSRIPGGHSNYSAVHMRVQRNAKKGFFFRENAIHANRVYWSKCAYFGEKGSFLIL